MVKEIQLTQGYVALVDDEWYDRLSQYKWRAKVKADGKVYAQCNMTGADGRRRVVLMHRLITGAPDGAYVDHLNHLTLDNTIKNLHVCPPEYNNHNQMTRKDNTSGYKGVTFYPHLGKWGARIAVAGKRIFLGTFSTKEEAARAYNEAAKKYYGNYALPNEIPAA